MSERLQKVLAREGLASRRAIERWITAGRILVNGRVAQLGMSVSARDQIEVDGRRVVLSNETASTRIIVYHKPVGEICTRSDPQGRPTVFSALPKLAQGRWVAVGRLDINTTGLMLFVNDGALANQLMHPAANLAREYAVRIFGEVDKAMLDRLVTGVQLDDGMARFEEIVPARGRGINRWFYVVVMEGRNRFVRRLWESQGVQVSRLKRVRFGPIFLDAKLSPGGWVELDEGVRRSLMNHLSGQTAAQNPE